MEKKQTEEARGWCWVLFIYSVVITFVWLGTMVVMLKQPSHTTTETMLQTMVHIQPTVSSTPPQFHPPEHKPSVSEIGRTHWPLGSERFVGMKTNFTFENPVINHNLPKRNPSRYSYVNSDSIKCEFTVTHEKVSCDEVARRLPILLPDEVFVYYCEGGVCMEPGKCRLIVGADPFWYDPVFKVKDREAVRLRHYPAREVICKELIDVLPHKP